jgi:hypothetical protein
MNFGLSAIFPGFLFKSRAALFGGSAELSDEPKPAKRGKQDSFASHLLCVVVSIKLAHFLHFIGACMANAQSIEGDRVRSIIVEGDSMISIIENKLTLDRTPALGMGVVA